MTPTSGTARRLPGWLVGTGVIALAMAVMNLSTYGFTILAARLLGPREYGALAAVMGLLLVVNVVSLGLQATGARRVSAAPDDRVAHEREVLTAGYGAALGVGLLALLAAPAVTALLRLDGWTTAVLLAVASVPLTAMGGQAGVLQGERRWLPLAGVYVAMGLGRVGCGAVALVLEPTAGSAVAGVAVGGFAPVLVGWLAIRHLHRHLPRPGPAGPRGRSGRDRLRRAGGSWAPGGVLREIGHNSHALLAFFALSNADVIIARTMLPDYQSGLYAGGLILTKAVLFLPQFVVVVAFPTMAEEGGRRSLHLRGLALVLGIGAVATLGAGALSGLGVLFIGGAEYAAIEGLLWAFAAVGTVLALTQMMVYSVVARQSQRAVLAIWTGLAALLAMAPAVGSVTFLLTAVAATESAVLLVLLLRGLVLTRSD